MKIEDFNVKVHPGKDQLWLDEKGTPVPYNRTTPLERLMERQSSKVLKEAIKAHNTLRGLKQLIAEVSQLIYAKFMNEQKLDPTKSKGNFTWHNFDYSIKIEISISERIDFDEMMIRACREKLDEFLNGSISTSQEFIKQMVLDAFKTSKGKLDAKKVMSLLKYRGRIKEALFQEALDLLEASIRRPSSKKYFRVWAKDEQGEYQNIDLNLSSI